MALTFNSKGNKQKQETLAHKEFSCLVSQRKYFLIKVEGGNAPYRAQS